MQLNSPEQLELGHRLLKLVHNDWDELLRGSHIDSRGVVVLRPEIAEKLHQETATAHAE